MKNQPKNVDGIVRARLYRLKTKVNHRFSKNHMIHKSWCEILKFGTKINLESSKVSLMD